MNAEDDEVNGFHFNGPESWPAEPTGDINTTSLAAALASFCLAAPQYMRGVAIKRNQLTAQDKQWLKAVGITWSTRKSKNSH